MRGFKIVTRIATAAAAAVASTLLLGSLPAHADTIFIQVSPSTINAGLSVSLRASCGAAVNPATAKSDAFGTITLMPDEKNLLTGTATVPSNTRPHGYTVKLTCASGSTAATTLWVISPTHPTQGPNTGGGFLSHQGNDPYMLIGGAAALLAGSGLAVVALRRRRSVEPI